LVALASSVIRAHLANGTVCIPSQFVESAMPRRAAADVLVPFADFERPKPPDGMGEAAAAIWTRTVSCMKPAWFTPETHELLRRYCGAMAEADRLEVELFKTPIGLPVYDRLRAAYSEMAKLALSYGRALRLTPKSNKESKADGRDPRRSNLPRPWDD
jgi:hypothetical protein